MRCGGIKKEFGIERKTEIIDVEKKKIDLITKVIEPYSCFITISKENYVKKLLKTTELENIKVKDNDYIIKGITTNNIGTLLVFTDKQNCYKILIDDLKRNTPSGDLGTYLPSIIQLEKDENIISVQVTEDYSGYLINIYENNLLSKIPLKSFETKQKLSKLKNSLSDDKLIQQFIIKDDIDLICISSLDKVLIVSTNQFTPKNTRNSNGQLLMKSKDNSVIKNVIKSENNNKYNFVDYNYYVGKRGTIGNYLRKGDSINE